MFRSVKISVPRMILALSLACFVPTSFGQSIGQIPNDLPLVINEFMASNGSIETDPQGQYEDWIELHNHGVSDINLGGMYLTDDLSTPTRWRIPPETMIGPGAYLLIWADNDITDAGLHASFKLDAQGEEIGLFDPDGISAIDSIIFPRQTTDMAYGRHPDTTDDWRFFSTPTPGSENGDAYLGEVAGLSFSHNSDIHDEPFLVTIATETEGATIYYTLNGENPLEMNLRGRPMGSVYREPILIDKNTSLRAQAIRTHWKPSSLETRIYTFLASDVQDFSSNLPILIVETYGKAISYSANPSYEPSSVMVVEPNDNSQRSTLNGPSRFSSRCGFRVRGRSSSFLWPKMQYALEIWNQHNGDKSVSLLGFPPESDWVLLGPYSDKTMMRTVLPYQWSNEIGRYAARTRFVEMFLDTGDRRLSYGDYLGVYVFMEKVKRDENRVDIQELAPGHDDLPEITGGYLLRKDWAESPHFDTVTGMELEYREPRADEITEPQKAYIKDYMDEFEEVLYGPAFKDPLDGYAKYIDVDSFIDHHLMTEMPKNGDGYYHSTFMFKERSGKLELGPIWDYNLSMGNFRGGDLSSPQGWYYPMRGPNGTHKWFIRLFEDFEFRMQTADRWFDLRERIFSNTKLLADIDSYALLLDEAQGRNFERWKVLGQQVDYNPPGWRERDNYQKEVDWLKTWLEDRLAWMDQAMAAQRASAPPVLYVDGTPHDDNGYVQSGGTLSISASGGRIYYTLDGSDPRLAGSGPQTESLRHVLVSEKAEKKILIPSRPFGSAWRGNGPFNDRSWQFGTGSVGYDTGSAYGHFINTDVQDLMYQGQSSCYIRVYFDHVVQDMNQLDTLTLKLRYDDGFIAYLNGIEVARANAPESSQWNSTATAENSDETATRFQDFDISSHVDVLSRGKNVLAIQGLNISPSDSDFLISAELVLEKSDANDDAGISPSAHAYIDPLTLTQSVTIKARTLSGQAWSALNKATYAVGPVTESLYIMQVVYQTQADVGEAFIELANGGAQTINLNLVKFTRGIDFTFPNIELTPTEHVVVVQNREAFAARHGTDVRIAGQYEGMLNPGESVRLADALGRTIQDFPLQDN